MKKPDLRARVLRLLPVAAMLILAGLLLLSGRKLTLHTVLSYTPSSPFRAAAALLLMYALKSLSIVFPILALFAAGGFLFPWQVAIPLNLFGLSIALTLPYLIGRWAGMDEIRTLTEKHPRAQEFLDRQDSHGFFFSFIIRAFGVLSCDLVSMYCGATRVRYRDYLCGALLGFLPDLIAVTLFGDSATRPGSPMFWVTLGLTVLFSLLSFGGYFLYRHRKNKKGM